jgi:hypothetical protein
MKKFLLILAGIVLLALLVLVLLFFFLPSRHAGSAGDATTGNASVSSGNATLAGLLSGNATTSSGNATAKGNATSANATSANATAGNGTAAGPPKVPQDLVAGAYLSSSVANATVADLRGMGLTPALFNRPDASGAVWWEVHLGRFPDLASAEAEAARLGREKNVWARPRPVDPAAKPVATAKGPATVFLVSAGEYLTRHAADERAKELAGLGFEPCVVRGDGEGDVQWYAVALGQATSEAEAAAISQKLAAKIGLPGRVTAEDAASLAKRRLCE